MNERWDLSRRRITVGVVVAVVVVAAIAFVLATDRSKTQTKKAPVEALGTIASINGSTLAMTSSGVTTEPGGRIVKVLTSASTRFIVHTAGALSDLQVGDNVLVMGTTDGPVFSAQEVIGGGSKFEDNQRGLRGAPPPPSDDLSGRPPEAPRRSGDPPVGGVVKNMDGSSFTLAKPDGTTVNVRALGSTVTVLEPSALDALHVGDVIRVVGLGGSKNTIEATSIRTRAG